MPLLILLGFPVLEIVIAMQVADEVGYLYTLLLLVGAALVGFGLLSITGRTFLIELQTRAVRGEKLENVLLSQAARFFAGLLFILPGFASDVLGLLALIGSLVPSLFAKPINNNVKRWNSKFVVFTHENGGFQGAPPGYEQRQWSSQPRDVTPEDPRVIDVSPEKPRSED